MSKDPNVQKMSNNIGWLRSPQEARCGRKRGPQPVTTQEVRMPNNPYHESDCAALLHTKGEP